MTWPWRERKAERFEARAHNIAMELIDIDADWEQAEARAAELRRWHNEQMGKQIRLRAYATRLRSAPWWKPVRGVR